MKMSKKKHKTIKNAFLGGVPAYKRNEEKKPIRNYGFEVRFKKRTSKKERQRVIEMVLKQKCVDNIQGAVVLK